MRHLLIALLCLAQVHAQKEATRPLALHARLLSPPVCNGVPKQLVKLEVGGKTVREVEIKFTSENQPHFFAFLDVTAGKGQPAMLRGPVAVIAAIKCSDAINPS